MSDKLKDLFRGILSEIGEDPEREGLLKTPASAAEALRYLTGGYRMSLDEVLNNAIFEASGDDMIIVRNIEYFSLCEHHVLPFFGRVHVGYIPNGKILGVSKVARVVEVFSRRLQVQERMTTQIAEALDSAIRPIGVGVVCEGKHLCMMARGVEKQHSSVTTSHVIGVFRDDPATRAEFLDLIRPEFEPS
jgi:GTP cyclohydrolase I